MEICVLQPLNCVCSRLLCKLNRVQKRVGLEWGLNLEMSLGLEITSVTAQQYQEAGNSRHVCSLPQLFTACLSPQMSSLNPARAAEEGAALRGSRLLIEQLLLGNQSSRAAPDDQQTASNLLAVRKIVTRQMSDHVEPSECFWPLQSVFQPGHGKEAVLD